MDKSNNISGRLTDSTAQQLLALLGQGASWNPTWSDDDLAAILRFQLASPLRSALGGSAAPDQTFRQLLTAPAPDLDALRAVRHYAKESRARKGDALPSAVATVLYYAAIAVALTRCGCRITRLADRELQEGLRWSASREWVDASLREIFEQALTRRQQDEGHSHEI